MEISEKSASYLFKGIIIICITIVVCSLIIAIDGRYQSFSSGSIEGYSSGYVVDTWTGKAWSMGESSYILLEEYKKEEN